MKKYDVFRNKMLVFTGNVNDAIKITDRLNKFLEYCEDTIIMIEHNENITVDPVYNNYNEFINSYYNRTCFNDLNRLYDSCNKYIVKNDDELASIVNSSPNNADLTFLDISNVNKLPKIKPNMVLKWDTSNIKRFVRSFSYSNNNDPIIPYQYDLDWLVITKEAITIFMFKDTKFNKKLPRTEKNIQFNDFVDATSLIVTPKLLENNDMSVDEWCKTKHNKKLMKTNKQYDPMLEYWLNTDFITIEEKIDAMKESGIEIFEI